ncbi:MAG: MarR family winged helix-turn-helix transcriptional regulator [Petrotogales bacterium]
MKNTKEDSASKTEQVLRSVYIRIKREGRKVVKNFPITPAQFDVLQILYFHGKKRMSDISQTLGITKSTTTGLVDRLIEAEFVKKRQSHEDRRAFIIDITNKGKKVIEKVIERRVNYLENILDIMDDRSKKQLQSSLNTLLEAMEQYSDREGKL